MKILYKYPTRERREWFLDTLGTYYDKMSGLNPFQFFITIDCDDVQMNRAGVFDFLHELPNLNFHKGPHKSKIEAVNAGMDLCCQDWDILVLVSDDMIPVVENFDDVIVQLMEEHFPDTDGTLHFHDGCFGEDRTITLSIIGRKLYETLGYIYHPDYKSFYCDNEFTDVVRAMNKVHYDPRVIIKHKWSGGPESKDALYRRNSKMGVPDEDVYHKRKSLGFPKESVS